MLLFPYDPPRAPRGGSRPAVALLALLGVFACAAPDESGAGDTSLADSGDTDTEETDTDTEELPGGLNGVAPAAPIALPSFTARTQAEATRTEADLLGHPTVLWFYPAAGTYG